jgi:hypothetical protein
VEVAISVVHPRDINILIVAEKIHVEVAISAVCLVALLDVLLKIAIRVILVIRAIPVIPVIHVLLIIRVLPVIRGFPVLAIPMHAAQTRYPMVPIPLNICIGMELVGK